MSKRKNQNSNTSFDESRKVLLERIFLLHKKQAYISKKQRDLESKLLAETNKKIKQDLLHEKNILIREEDSNLIKLKQLQNEVDKLDAKVRLAESAQLKKEKMHEMEIYLYKKAVKRVHQSNQDPKQLQSAAPPDPSPHHPESATTRNTFVVVEWENVRFLDHALVFEIARNHFSEPFHYEPARKSFNFLKKYFRYKKLPPLKVTFSRETPVNVLNVEELKTVLEILQIESYIHFDLTSKALTKVFSLSQFNLHKNSICRIYDLYSKSMFFNYLIGIHHDSYKIIPVPEVILDDHYRVIKTEDSFIFTFTKQRSIYLVWESVIERKATYLFETCEAGYLRDLQLLFDFLCSPDIKNKRETILTNPVIAKRLKYKMRFLHTVPGSWLSAIKSC